ncbi:MAG: sulfatase, partial [Planctomycetota bacterium]
DPYETKNLAVDPAFAAVTSRMRNRLREIVKALPDLSLYPESYLVDHAFVDPVAFGQAHKSEIAQLVDTADLSLVPFQDAAKSIEQSLASDDPWQRYWALIACSSHGDAAQPFVATAKKLAARDGELLVRVRAAEFLGLLGAVDPQPTIMSCLAQTTSPVEASLILNTLVLLRDGQPGYKFKVSLGDLKTLKDKQADGVQRRMEYLTAP